ncbi:MAG: RrF2 family transcriptional regulator [Candidatus Anammoxibacter sp.]
MKLSSKTEYAVLALLELGTRFGEGFMLSRQIAKKRSIPESFLDRILLTLKNAGIIISVRGATGGHYLAKKPDELDIRSIIELFEGSLAPSDCVNERISFSVLCPSGSACVVKNLWQKMYDAMLSSIEDVTLQDLISGETSIKKVKAKAPKV